MRGLKREFVNDLKNPDGLLRPILDRVKQDHTLLLAIREDSINVYYRGGNLVRIEEQQKGISYCAFFDPEYNKRRLTIPECPRTIRSKEDSRLWVRAFPQLKETMDLFFVDRRKPEREFQQLVARENNFSTVSNETEYFIVDIEHEEDRNAGARFDMLAIRWLASDRRDGSRCQASLIEMKYGDGALGGKSGLVKHLDDIHNLVSDPAKYADLISMMTAQFNQLDELGLLTFNRARGGVEIKLDPKNRPEVIILLANHNPRSTKLARILNDPAVLQYQESSVLDLRFFVSSFAGYGMHRDSILGLDEFRQLLSGSPHRGELPD
jgi:hypothetical protein